MRVFIAIDIPEDIRKRLATMQDELRPASTSARWVPTESIHLTLRFIGEIREKRRADIDNALADLSWKPFPVKVRGVGFFPGARSPRVFWAGLESSTMEALASEIDSRLESAGFEQERRAFRAHVTLARAKERPLEKALVTAATPFSNAEFGTFTVNRCFLYESVSKPGGSVYTKLKEFRL